MEGRTVTTPQDGAALAASDEAMMRQALALAARGAGLTAPNPMVGCVIARAGQVLGEGWHRGRGWHPVDGRDHAEVEAIRSAIRAHGPGATRGATAYVTLEPCNHTGATPPCARALIDAGLARVVIAMADPNPLAAGGTDTLRAAGIAVTSGILERDAEALNRAWLHHLRTRRPHTIAKFAASLDGRIATRTGDSQWITGTHARARAHDLRQMADAIIVGAGTIVADNPSLTVRTPSIPPEKPAHPLRVILDPAARTAPLASVYRSETPGTALVATTERAEPERLAAFRRAGIETLLLPTDNTGAIPISALLEALGARGCLSAMVEGGAATLGRFFDAGLIDEVWAFIAPVLLGNGAPAFAGLGAASLADALRLENTVTETLGQDILIRGAVCRARKEAACSQAS